MCTRFRGTFDRRERRCIIDDTSVGYEDVFYYLSTRLVPEDEISETGVVIRAIGGGAGPLLWVGRLGIYKRYTRDILVHMSV